MSEHKIYPNTVVPGATTPYASAVAAPVTMDGTRRPQVSADLLDLHQQKAGLQAEMERNSVASIVTDATANLGSIGATIATRGSQFAGVAGHAANLGVSVFNGNKTAQRDLEDLMVMHMDTLVQEFDIPPQEVTTDHLRWLAERPNQDQLLTQVQEIDQRMGRAATTSVAGMAGSAVGMAVAPLIVGGAISVLSFGTLAVPGIVLGLGGAMIGGSIASNQANSIVNSVTGIDPLETGFAELKRMNDKISRGEQVNAIDTFKALLAGDKNLQTTILRETGGKKFDDLDIIHQAQLLEQHHPKLLEASHQLGYMINVGIIAPARLMTLPTPVLEHPEQGGAQAAHTLVSNDIKFGYGVRKRKMMEQEAQRASLEQSYAAPDAVPEQEHVPLPETTPVKAGGWAEAELKRRAEAAQQKANQPDQEGFVAAEMQRRVAAGPSTLSY